jgi:tRNA threonylcarbamoyladenosine biosynthesis protein TsaB
MNNFVTKIQFLIKKMICLLLLDTSTKVCSLVLTVNGKPVFARTSLGEASHASLLGVFAREAVEYARARHFKIDAVGVSAGPGSYTGLRIGISEAKGLCYGLGVGLIAVPTLKILASACLASGVFLGEPAAGFLCPMIDARRMEVYTALYDTALNEIQPARSEIVVESSYKEFLDKGKVVFFGDGSDKSSAIIRSANALFVRDIHPHAKAMIPLAEEAFKECKFVDIAYFEPFYLKEFQATVAKNKVLTPYKGSSAQPH